MPQLPIIVSTQSPRSAPKPFGSIGVAAQPGEAAARLGEAAANVGLDILHQQNEIRNGRKLLEALTGAQREAEDLYANQLAQPDHEGLAAGVTAGFSKISEKYGKALKDPQTKLQFDRSFTGLTLQREVDAAHEERAREISRASAMVNEELDALSNMAVGASGQQLDSILAMTQGVLAWAAKTGIRTSEQAQKQLSAWDDEVYSAKYIEEIRTRPHQAFVDISADSHLAADKKQYFLNNAQNAIESADAEAMRQRLQQEKDREELFKKQQTAAEADYSARAQSGELSLTELEQGQKLWEWDRASYDILRDHVIAGPQSPNDANTLTNDTLAAHDNTISEGQLAAHYRSGLLNRDAFQELVSKLRTTQEHAKSNAGSGLEAQNTQAKQLLRGSLGFASEFDFGTEETKRILSLAMEDYTKLSSYYGGSVAPFEAVKQVQARYLPLRTELVNNRVQDIVKTLPVQATDAQGVFHVDQARTQLGTLAQAQAKGISREEYLRIGDRLDELDRLQQEIAKMPKPNTGGQ